MEKQMITYRTEKNFEEGQLKELFQSVGWISANYSDRLVRALANSDTVISAWDGNRLVGLANAIDDGELTAYVHYLLVNPDYQGQGIGREIAERIKEKYRNYLALVLTAENRGVVDFYRKLDFQVIDGASPMAIHNYYGYAINISAAGPDN